MLNCQCLWCSRPTIKGRRVQEIVFELQWSQDVQQSPVELSNVNNKPVDWDENLKAHDPNLKGTFAQIRVPCAVAVVMVDIHALDTRFKTSDVFIRHLRRHIHDLRKWNNDDGGRDGWHRLGTIKIYNLVDIICINKPWVEYQTQSVLC